MATIESEEQAQTVASIIKQYNVGDILIGATDRDEEGLWRWIENNQTMSLYPGDLGKDTTYTAWSGQEPNDWNMGEDCVVFSARHEWTDGTGQTAYLYNTTLKIYHIEWYDSGCHNRRFICSLRLWPGTFEHTTTTTTTAFPVVLHPN